MRLPRWRKMTWVIVVWCVLMAIWIVGVLVGADNGQECAREATGVLSKEDCETFRDAGTGIGVIVLWFIWFFGFITLSLLWFMSRPKDRVCPVCGENVKRGLTECRNCGHDFAASVLQPQS